MTEVAKTYGGALYELSVEENTSAETLEELGAIRSLFLENPQFSKLLLTPTLQKEERLAVIDNTFGGKVQQNVVNFLKIPRILRQGPSSRRTISESTPIPTNRGRHMNKARFNDAARRYQNMVYRTALHALGSPQDAEDAVQTVFRKLLEYGRTLPGPEHEKAWFLKVTLNGCRKVWRSA